MSLQSQKLAVDGVHLGASKKIVAAIPGLDASTRRPFLTYDHRNRVKDILDGRSLQIEGRETIRVNEPFESVGLALGDPEDEFDPSLCLPGQRIAYRYRMPGGSLVVECSSASIWQWPSDRSKILGFNLLSVASVSQLEVDGIALGVSRWKVDAIPLEDESTQTRVTYTKRDRVEEVEGQRLTVLGRGDVKVGDSCSRLTKLLGKPDLKTEGICLYNVQGGRLWVQIRRRQSGTSSENLDIISSLALRR